MLSPTRVIVASPRHVRPANLLLSLVAPAALIDAPDRVTLAPAAIDIFLLPLRTPFATSPSASVLLPLRVERSTVAAHTPDARQIDAISAANSLFMDCFSFRKSRGQTILARHGQARLLNTCIIPNSQVASQALPKSQNKKSSAEKLWRGREAAERRSERRDTAYSPMAPQGSLSKTN